MFFTALAATLGVLIATHSSSGQDADCDYFQNVVKDTTYYVYSPKYPQYYPKGKTCRWRAACPTGHVCHLNCNEVTIPASSNCVNDRFMVSRTGEPYLSGADKYCGNGNLDIRSVDNQISIGLVSAANSVGGRFYCVLTSEPKTVVPTPSCSCGWKRNTKIVGGQETLINEYPMMAGLKDVSLRGIYCGATIISKRYVVTAAHCLDYQTVGNVRILVGVHDVRYSTNGLTAERFIIHPNFNRNKNSDYDIGLVRASTDIIFSQLVGPACLPFKYSTYSFDGFYVEALGWGSNYSSGPDSDVLQKVSLKVISQSECSSKLPIALTARQMCTLEKGKDACQNDSGGPLVWQDTNTGTVYHVGIISLGQGCATIKPGVNTRLTMFTDWIVLNTPTETYCKI